MDNSRQALTQAKYSHMMAAVAHNERARIYREAAPRIEGKLNTAKERLGVLKQKTAKLKATRDQELKDLEAEIKRYERMNARSKVQLKAEQKRLRDALKE
jgi:hypothetical protein